jgi:hypothetical protein
VAAVHRDQFVPGRDEHALELLDRVEELAGAGLLDPVGDPGGGRVVRGPVLGPGGQGDAGSEHGDENGDSHRVSL